jgi:hypothetical protein
MKQNLGTVDRKLRALIGLLLLAFGVYLQIIKDNQLIGWVVIIVSGLPLTTSISGVCLPYKWIGINTVHNRFERKG